MKIFQSSAINKYTSNYHLETPKKFRTKINTFFVYARIANLEFYLEKCWHIHSLKVLSGMWSSDRYDMLQLQHK